MVGFVDVTRCRIRKPTYNQGQYWSAKDGYHALKYEVACNNNRFMPQITWVRGPFFATIHDLTLFRLELKWALSLGQHLIADKAYVGGYPEILAPFRPAHDAIEVQWNFLLHQRRTVIKRVNGRLKNFSCLVQAWRHDFLLHHMVFHVIAQVTNIMLYTNPL